METQVTALCNAVMLGVHALGVLKSSDSSEKLDSACKIMQAEVKAFLFDERYASARDCAMRRSIHDGYIVGLVVAECASQIRAL